MAVYRQLSIAAGGGVISTSQQAEQVENTATVLIGLGGTGIDALRTIKTQVYSRLKPDDPNAVDKTYKHIRFLGVDTDEKSKGDAKSEQEKNAEKKDAKLALEKTEQFSIANGNLRQALASPGLANRRELSWLRYDEIPAPDLGAAGAGGIRQVGRFMMMDRSQEFMSKLEQTINSAKEGLTGTVGVNIHIFSGIGGGTGSGTFLDVCYMARKVCSSIGNVTLYGYVFLPDVNIAKISAEDALTQKFIRQNGYAAMQEIDYCMQMQHNGGAFEQEYKGARIVPWNCAPVDMCHLVCATNTAGHVIPNAYDYAMHVTSEYIMDFLTKSSQFGLEQNLANFRAKLTAADTQKEIGSYLGYCVIGASCARLPLREINTYLAAELFEKFSRIGTNRPTQGDVEQLALGAMAPGQQQIGAIYNALWQEIYNGAFDGYNQFEDQWKNVIGNDEAMVNFYIAQSAGKMNLLETGAKAMMDKKNERSLFGRMKHYLEGVIGDVNRGPIFAYRMLEAGQTHNLLNIIDGLIEENKVRWNNEAFQDRYGEYQYARDRFHNRKKKDMFETDKARFEEYRYRVEVLEQHKFWLEVFDRMDKVLNTFRTQVEEAATTYYIKLARVMQTLIETFAENRQLLLGGALPQNESPISEHLVTIQELQRTLDAEVERIHVPGMLQAFMGLFLDPNNEDKWLKEDESEITKLVTDFFVKRAFADFANRSVTSFLKDKYQTTTDSELASKVHDEWMVRLTDKASPLFYFDSNIWDSSKTSDLAFLSFPEASGPVQQAAAKMKEDNDLWQPKPSALSDRIFVMRSACALPLGSYQNCREYELDYFSSVSLGRHYYEGKPVEGMVFDDWRKLPSLTPQSLVDMAHAPYQLKEQVEAARALFVRANEAGLFSDNNKLSVPVQSAMDDVAKQAEAAIELAKKVKNVNQKDQVEAARDALKAAVENLPMVETEDAMANDGLAGRRDVRLRVLEDHFVSAPVYQMKVAKTLETLDALKAKVAEADAALDDALKKVDNPALPTFVNALFTGVIKFVGEEITYKPNDVFADEITLSKMSAEFEYGDIPVYQAFLRFQALPEELQKEIRSKTDELRNSKSPTIAATTRELVESLSEKNFKFWGKMARTLQGTSDIEDFLRQVWDRFDTHKMRYLDE